MQSRTSYFNAALFSKTVKRFWPIWVSYLFIMLEVLPVRIAGRLSSAFREADASYITGIVQDIPLREAALAYVPAMIICIFMATAVFSYLYNSRSACAYASLPIKREGVFISVGMAGLIPLILCNAVVFLLAVVVESAYGVLYITALLDWFGAACLSDLFFFGFASLCATLTGNTIILPVVYVILNFTAVVVETVAKSVFKIFVFGFGSAMGEMKLSFLSPPARMAEVCSFVPPATPEAWSSAAPVPKFHGMETLAVYAAVGIVCAVLAVLICKRRRMESVGDIVAVKWLRPVFKYCLSCGCALCIGTLLYFTTSTGGVLPSESGWILFLLMSVGAFIGYFAAEMLIEKSFLVFTGIRRWAGCIAVFALCGIFVLIGCTGLLGYEKYTPDPQNVKKVCLTVNGLDAVFEDSENIASVIDLQKSIVGNKKMYENPAAADSSDPYFYSYENIMIVYCMKDGRSVERNYNLEARSKGSASDLYAAQDLMNTKESVSRRLGNDYFPLFSEDNFVSGKIDYAVENESGEIVTEEYELNPAEAIDLFKNCIQPDISDGSMGRIWFVEDERYEDTVLSVRIYLQCATSSGGDVDTHYFDIAPTTDSVRTDDWLREHGIETLSIGESGGVCFHTNMY